MPKRLITGFKPTGDIHIGNYLGVLQPLLEYEKEYDFFVFIANYHALTTVKDSQKLRHWTLEIAKTLMVLGLDLDKVTLFLQSDIPEVCELTWIFNNIISMPYLERAHAYKAARTENKAVNVGVFDYPALMAADILIYDAEIVPVGQDQKQHVEIARQVAKTFNKIYGPTFVLPQEKIKDEVATVRGLDGRKMSKSYNNVIGLFDSEEETRRKVMSIVTDSRGVDEPKDPEKCNIFALHKFFSRDILEELADRYRQGKIGYKESKEILAENINKELREMRRQKKELDKNKDYVKKILQKGAEKARIIAQKKIKEVRQKIGLEIFKM